MKPVIGSIGRVREGVIVGGGLLGGDLAAVGLASVLSARDPLVDLIVGPVGSVDELLPLADFFRVVLLHLSGLHLDNRILLIGSKEEIIVLKKVSKLRL